MYLVRTVSFRGLVALACVSNKHNLSFHNLQRIQDLTSTGSQSYKLFLQVRFKLNLEIAWVLSCHNSCKACNCCPSFDLHVRSFFLEFTVWRCKWSVVFSIPLSWSLKRSPFSKLSLFVQNCQLQNKGIFSFHLPLLTSSRKVRRNLHGSVQFSFSLGYLAVKNSCRRWWLLSIFS